MSSYKWPSNPNSGATAIGKYIYDPEQNWVITSKRCILAQDIPAGTTSGEIQVENTTDMPAYTGNQYLVFSFTYNEEAVMIPYLGKTANSILIPANYEFMKAQLPGRYVNIIKVTNV